MSGRLLGNVESVEIYGEGVAVAVRWVGKTCFVLAEDFLVLVVNVESVWACQELCLSGQRRSPKLGGVR